MTSATEELIEATDEGFVVQGAVEGRLGLVIAGTYRVTRHIGSGGSSHVFEVVHERLGKSFAVKLLRPELGRSKRVGQRFRREAKAVARLQSEHVVSVTDCGVLEDETPYVVMELLAGEDLRSALRREGALPARRAVRIIVEACRGLSVVHDAGLVHRDLKPENLFLARRSTGQDWCKVLDFGVAKMETSLSTAQGAIVGTVRYMAPEQLADSGNVGPSTDVYALGAILYECLSGHAMHQGESVQSVMYSVMNREPLSIAELRPSLPGALVQAVERACAKDASARPATTAELAALLLESVAPSADWEATVSDEVTSAVPGPRAEPGALRRFLALSVTLCAGFAAGWLVSQATAQPRAWSSPVAPAAKPAPPIAAITAATVTTAAPPAPSTASPASAPPPRPALRAPASPASSSAAQAKKYQRFEHENPYGD